MFQEFLRYNHVNTGSLIDRFGMMSFQITRHLSDLCHRDIAGAAVVNNLARSAPFLNISQTEVNANRIESWEKEIAATTGPVKPQVIDFNVWFSDEEEYAYHPLSEFVPPAPKHNIRIRRLFREWKDNLSGRLLFPQMQTNKTVSRDSARIYHDRVHDQEVGSTDKSVSSADLEKFYKDSGIRVGGGCELRQAWKYNEITPRTYFAQGGSAYHASKYIRVPINEMTNSFDQTHFITRFSYRDLLLDDQTTAFIYDYTSFTSLLGEIKYFFEALAGFCDDTMVYIMDSRKGICEQNLGELFREYNQVCNIQGEFTVQRYLDGENSPLIHEVAGFLGVYGNIASSTSLHGLHACQLCGDDSDCRCVGDDIFGILRLGDNYSRDQVIQAIETLGKIHREKIKWWPFKEIEDEGEDDHAWPYIKRPFDRLDNKMILEPALFLPIFGLINPIPDILNRERETIYVRIKLLATQTYSCIKQAQTLYPPLEIHQKQLIQAYIRFLYKALGVHLKGYLPCETFLVNQKPIRNIFMPCIEDDDFLDVDPWDLVRYRFDAFKLSAIRLPRMVREPLENQSEVLIRFREPIETTMNQVLAYLRRIDLVVCEEINDDWILTFEEYVAFYEALFRGDLVKEYNVSLIVKDHLLVNDLLQFLQTGLSV